MREDERELEEELRHLKQENEELKERIKCKCFDSKSNNNRCISYNRIAEDYERDLRIFKQLKQENEELKTQLQQYIDLCKQKTVDIFEMDKEITKTKAKLEKIKEYCKKLLSDWHYRDIKDIIEGDNVSNNNQQHNS